MRPERALVLAIACFLSAVFGANALARRRAREPAAPDAIIAAAALQERDRTAALRTALERLCVARDRPAARAVRAALRVCVAEEPQRSRALRAAEYAIFVQEELLHEHIAALVAAAQRCLP